MPIDPPSLTPTPPATAERWVIVLVPELGEVPVGRRVAQVLKTAKRVHGLRCIEASATTLPEQLERLRAEVLRLQAAGQVRTEIDAQIDDSREVAEEKGAAKRVAKAEEEAEKVRVRHTAAKSAYDAAIAEGRDPRPYRGEITKSGSELQDVELWLGRLRAVHTAATRKVDARVAEMWRSACQAKQAELAQRRAELKARVEKKTPSGSTSFNFGANSSKSKGSGKRTGRGVGGGS